MRKPKKWNYKTGKKKGKLRPKAKKYLSYKLKRYWAKVRSGEATRKGEYSITFLNFSFKDAPVRYVRGYLITAKTRTKEELIKAVNMNIVKVSKGIPYKFEIAHEIMSSKPKDVLVVLRDGSATQKCIIEIL